MKLLLEMDELVTGLSMRWVETAGLVRARAERWRGSGGGL